MRGSGDKALQTALLSEKTNLDTSFADHSDSETSLFILWSVFLISSLVWYFTTWVGKVKKKRAAELTDNFDFCFKEEQTETTETEDPDQCKHTSHKDGIIAWLKIFVITAHFVFLYFVIVCIGARCQVEKTKRKLPYVQEAIYHNMNEGPVCAFDNRGPKSNITTFEDKDLAHEAGFLVLHCGACGACSSWENLIIEYTTRNTISELANECAKFRVGGDNAITECLKAPAIGFGAECAQCWMQDIVCTRKHCAFIFLRSQITRNVGNFDVGPDEITSATCEEANCEAGNPGEFVTCSGATRRRMNITSSIARPPEQQCAIVDVKDWYDLFFGSGVA
jgi:hypothetical protein